MKSLKIKKGDRVKVIAGNDKGAIGESSRWTRPVSASSSRV